MGTENNHSLHNPPTVANNSIALTSILLIFVGSYLNKPISLYARFSNTWHVGKLSFTGLFSIQTWTLLIPF